MDQKLVLQHLHEITCILSDLQADLGNGEVEHAFELADHAKRHAIAVFEADQSAYVEAVRDKPLECLLTKP